MFYALANLSFLYEQVKRRDGKRRFRSIPSKRYDIQVEEGESLIKACGCPKSRRKSGNTDRLSFGKADVFPAGLTSLSAQCGPIIREKKD